MLRESSALTSVSIILTISISCPPICIFNLSSDIFFLNNFHASSLCENPAVLVHGVSLCRLSAIILFGAFSSAPPNRRARKH